MYEILVVPTSLAHFIYSLRTRIARFARNPHAPLEINKFTKKVKSENSELKRKTMARNSEFLVPGIWKWQSIEKEWTSEIPVV